MSEKIFDTHIHIGKWGQFVIQGHKIDPFKNRTIQSVKSLKKFMKNHNITRAVIMPIYTPQPKVAFSFNEFVLKVAKALSNFIVPAFWVDPSPSMQKYLQQTIYLANNHNIRVLKMSPDAWDSKYSPNPKTWDSTVKKI